MPPALSDDEMSDASAINSNASQPLSKLGRNARASADTDSVEDEDDSDTGASKKRGGQAKRGSKANGTSTATAKSSDKNGGAKSTVNEDEDDDDDDDEDEDEEIYEVQEIVGHMVDKDGNPRFRVIWKGYDDPSDYTWEPEENLIGALEILNDYIAKIGGREKLESKPAKGKKRGRQSTSTSASASTKRSRKSEEHPADRETPSVVEKGFKPPSGSWEDDVVDVEMYRNGEGGLIVCLTWKTGQKTQHPAKQAYVRCPQRILRFYESRISFKEAIE